MEKLRVWWIPQLGKCKPFYVPVNSVLEAKKVLDIMAFYDAFQLENRIKPDYANTGGLEMWNEESQEWESWYEETEDTFYDDMDEYLSETMDYATVEEFTKSVSSNVNWDKIHKMFP